MVKNLKRVVVIAALTIAFSPAMADYEQCYINCFNQEYRELQHNLRQCGDNVGCTDLAYDLLEMGLVLCDIRCQGM